MSEAKVLQAAIGILEALPTLVALDQQVSALVSGTVAALRDMRSQGRAPTDAEWAAQDTEITRDLSALHDRKIASTD